MEDANIIEIIDDFKMITVKLEELERTFQNVKEEYRKLAATKEAFVAERKRLLNELISLCEDGSSLIRAPKLIDD